MGDRLEGVVGLDHLVAGQVRAGAGHPHGPVEAAGRQPAGVGGLHQHPQGLAVQGLAHVLGRRAGVEGPEPGQRHRPRRGDPVAHGRGRLTPAAVPQGLRRHGLHQRGQVEPVGQRPGQPGPVPLHLVGPAAAPVAGRPARAQVAGRHQQHPRWVADRRRRPGDPDLPLLQRFAQAVQDVAAPLEQLVEEQHPVAGLADRARPGHPAAAAEQRGPGGGVVGRGERWPAVKPPDRTAGDRADRGHLHRLGVGQVGKHPGETPGQHGLAGAGRAEQQQVVPTGRGHLHRPSGLALADDVGQVRHVAHPLLPQRRVRQGAGAAAQQGDHLGQAGHGQRLGHRGQLGLGDVVGGHQHRAPRASAQAGQDPADRPDLPVQRQLAEQYLLPRRQLLQRPQDRHDDGEVEPGAALVGVGRGEVDHDLAGRQPDADGGQRRLGPVGRLGEGGAAPAEQREAGQAVADVRLDGDVGGDQALKGDAARGAEAHQAPRRCDSRQVPSGRPSTATTSPRTGPSWGCSAR